MSFKYVFLYGRDEALRVYFREFLIWYPFNYNLHALQYGFLECTFLANF